MPRALAASLLLALFFVACEDSHSPDRIGFIGPTDLAAVTVGIQPTAVRLTPVPGAVCPMHPPFRSNFTVTVHERGGVGVSLDQVTFHLLDGSNISSPPITFPHDQLNGLFPSSMMIPALTSGSFNFAPTFGCGIGAPQVLVVDVDLVDHGGGHHHASARAPIG